MAGEMSPVPLPPRTPPQPHDRREGVVSLLPGEAVPAAAPAEESLAELRSQRVAQLHSLQNGNGKEEAEKMVVAGEAWKEKMVIKTLKETRRKKRKCPELKKSSPDVIQFIGFVLAVYEFLARGTPLPEFFHWVNVYSKCPQELVKDLHGPEQDRGVPASTWFIGEPADAKSEQKRKNRVTDDREGNWKQEHGPECFFMVQPDDETTINLLCYKTNFSYKLMTSDETTGWCMHEFALVLPDGAGKQVVLRKVHKSNRSASTGPRTPTTATSSSAGSSEVQRSDGELPGGDISSPAPIPALTIRSASGADAAAAAAALRKGKAVAVAEESRLSLIAAGVGGSQVLEELENALDCGPQTIDELGFDRSIVSDPLEVHPGQVAVTKELTPATISQFGRTQQMISGASSAGVKRKANAKVISEKKARAPPGTRQARSTDTDRDETGVDVTQTEHENTMVWARNFHVSVPEDYNHTMPVGVHDSSAGFDEPLDVADYLIEPAGFDNGAGDSIGEDYSMTMEGSLFNEPLPLHQWGSGGIEGTMNYSPLQSLQSPLEYQRHGLNGIVPDVFHDGEFVEPLRAPYGEFDFDDGDHFLNNLLEDAYACG